MTETVPGLELSLDYRGLSQKITTGRLYLGIDESRGLAAERHAEFVRSSFLCAFVVCFPVRTSQEGFREEDAAGPPACDELRFPLYVPIMFQKMKLAFNECQVI